MSTESNDFYQRIGEEAIRATEYAEGKLLVEAQVQEGVISAHLFHQARLGEAVQFHFVSALLSSLVYDFWLTGDGTVEPRSWVEVHYLIEGGRFQVKLIYADQLRPDEEPHERRLRITSAYFPGDRIDYPPL